MIRLYVALAWFCLLLPVHHAAAQAAPLDIRPTAGSGMDSAASQPARQARELNQRGQAALAEGNLFRANRAFRQALEIDPELHASRQGYARSLDAIGRPGRAVSVLREGLALEPGHLQIAVQLARLAADAGVPAVAIEAVRSVPSGSFPGLDDLERKGWLAALYLAAGRPGEALSRYVHLSDAEPESLKWHAGVAVSAEALGQLTEAHAAWRRIALLRGAPTAYRAYAAERIRRLGVADAPAIGEVSR